MYRKSKAVAGDFSPVIFDDNCLDTVEGCFK